MSQRVGILLAALILALGAVAVLAFPAPTCGQDDAGCISERLAAQLVIGVGTVVLAAVAAALPALRQGRPKE